MVADREMAVLLADAHLALAGALRASGDEPAARAAAADAQGIAATKQDQAALRLIETFLTVG
jgi:hypothetical protein